MKHAQKTPIDLVHELEASLEALVKPKTVPPQDTRLPPPPKVPTFDTVPASNAGPRTSSRELLERQVIMHAVDICASWHRRHKKNFNNQEQGLIDAVRELMRHG